MGYMDGILSILFMVESIKNVNDCRFIFNSMPISNFALQSRLRKQLKSNIISACLPKIYFNLSPIIETPHLECKLALISYTILFCFSFKSNIRKLISTHLCPLKMNPCICPTKFGIVEVICISSSAWNRPPKCMERISMVLWRPKMVSAKGGRARGEYIYSDEMKWAVYTRNVRFKFEFKHLTPSSYIIHHLHTFIHTYKYLHNCYYAPLGGA